MTVAGDFRALHIPGRPLLMANAYDVGSAHVLAAVGFRALATTSSGYAATLGRSDGELTRAEAIAHGGQVAAAVAVPVSADLENGFADDPAGVADCIAAAVAAGLAGCSIEDFDGAAIYDAHLARDRVAAAVEAAAGALVITARAENHIRGNPDLADTIARLQSYEAVGADVLYAPGFVAAADIAAVVAAVTRPVNVLAVPGAPSVAQLADLGVARVSIGGAFAYVAYGALAGAARELLDEGTYGFLDAVAAGQEFL